MKNYIGFLLFFMIPYLRKELPEREALESR